MREHCYHADPADPGTADAVPLVGSLTGAARAVKAGVRTVCTPGMALVMTLVVWSAPGQGAYGAAERPVRSATPFDIAYADGEGQVAIVPAGGGGERVLSAGDGFSTWPVWSPNGRQVAFSERARDREAAASTWSLYVGDARSRRTRLLYANDAGTGPILPSLPHYALWSPRGDHLAIMTNAEGGLALLLHDLHEGRTEQVLRAEPLYASWASGGRYLLVHGGGGHFLLDAREGFEPNGLALRSGVYRAPAWRPGATAAAVVRTLAGRGHDLVLKSVEQDRLGELRPGLPPDAAFLWAPDGQTIAVAEPATAGRRVYGVLAIQGPEAEKRTVLVNEEFLAFFWAPSGDLIALVTPTQAPGTLRWRILDLRTGEAWNLVDFVPSPEQQIVLRYFDQFAYSHSPWSPAGRNLVFSGRLASDPSVPRPGQASAVYVVNASRGARPGKLADGVIGTWSPVRTHRPGAED
jgi:Tol biopolymer transport system component